MENARWNANQIPRMQRDDCVAYSRNAAPRQDVHQFFAVRVKMQSIRLSSIDAYDAEGLLCFRIDPVVNQPTNRSPVVLFFRLQAEMNQRDMVHLFASWS